MVQQRHADQSGPQEHAQRTAQCAGDGPADRERGHEREDGENREQPVDHHQVGVTQQIGREPLLTRGVGCEEPTDVRPQEPSGGGGLVGAVADRGVRVAGTIAEHVVTTVRRHPTDHRSLERHGAGHGQDDFEHPVRIEAVVREEPVEPRTDAEAGEDIERRGEAEAPDGLGASPPERDEDGECHQGPGHQEGGDDSGRGQRTGRGALEYRLGCCGGDPGCGHPLENSLRHGVQLLPGRRGRTPPFGRSRSPWSRATRFTCILPPTADGRAAPPPCAVAVGVSVGGNAGGGVNRFPDDSVGMVAR